MNRTSKLRLLARSPEPLSTALEKSTNMEIQFAGEAGITQSCINAILRYLQFNDSLSKVLIITNKQSHALVLYTEDHEIIAIKSGFSSGYSGEGPKGFAYSLSHLDEYGIEIEENTKSQLLEFMALNHLFTLESTSKSRPEQGELNPKFSIEADILNAVKPLKAAE